MAGNTPPPPPETFISSRMPPDDGYGQNGYRGPSSLQPGKNTKQSPYAPLDDDAKSILKASGMSFSRQTRTIGARQAVPTAHGHKNPNANPAKIPGAEARPVAHGMRRLYPKR